MEKNSVLQPSICIFCKTAHTSLHVVAENKNFLIVSDGAPLAKGHLLLIPKKHILCYGALPDSLDSQFEKLREQISVFLQKHFGRIVLFEHGIAGQTVHHAHIHFLPADKKVLPTILKERRAIKIKDFSQLKKYYALHGQYLLLQEDKALYILSSENTPAGYFHSSVFPKILTVPNDFKKRSRNAEFFYTEIKKLWQKQNMTG